MWSCLILVLGCTSCSSMLLPPNNISGINFETYYQPADPSPSGYPENMIPLYRGSPQLPPDFPGPHLSNETFGSPRWMQENLTEITLMPEMRICTMILSSPEPVPLNQIPTFCFCSCKGTFGLQGEKGYRGPDGEPGSPGRRGLTGFRGRLGLRGRLGMKGEGGQQGQSGRSGIPGFTGPKGERGFKGEEGSNGDPGFLGIDGIQGESGSCSCNPVLGPPGQQGPIGPAGALGLPGVPGNVGLHGHKGDRGDRGWPGPPGVDGPKGEEGEQGPCNCTNGRLGSVGPPGTKGPKGERGVTGATGALGPLGVKGVEGNMGLMGLPGNCTSAIQSGFSASITRSFPSPGLPVPFPYVLSNRQGHFNPQVGIYTAPVNGTYIFYFHLTVAQRSLKVALYLNSELYSMMTGGHSFTTASMTVALRLQVQDQVWLQVTDEFTNGIYSDSESSSTFTGYLLHPESCHPSKQKVDEEVFVWNGGPAL